MEMFIGLTVAFFGAVLAYAFAEIIRHRDERKNHMNDCQKVIATLSSELELNLAIADGIINSEGTGMVSPKAGWEWREIAPLSEVAWSIVTSNGGLTHLNNEQIKGLLMAQAAVIATNYTAKNIQSRGYSIPMGEEYFSRIKNARESLEEAHKLLEESNCENK